jgi:hypothetical protein
LFYSKGFHHCGFQLFASQVAFQDNAVLAQQKPHPAVTLSILASLSAGYIRQLQQVYTAAGTNEVVEEAFQKLLTAQLTDLDMKDVRGEVTKIKNRDLN